MGSLGSPQEPYSAKFLIIGAGSRGNSYARAITLATTGTVHAIAEVDQFKREEFGRKYIWGPKQPQPLQEFASWQEWAASEKHRREIIVPAGNATGAYGVQITGVFICTLDETHAEIIRALAPFGLHIMCEKPLALSLADCLSISAVMKPVKVFSIGHVLRYSPHNTLLRKLVLEEQVIGEIVSIEHTEPVGWWHFSHSYVRGNWRRATPEGVGSLLTKSCHDIDFLLWLLCSPSKLTGDSPHLPCTITSTGALTHFRKSRKPKLAGSATNCLDCKAEKDCIYSAEKIYRDGWLRTEKDTGWPLKIVMPEIEDVVAHHGWDKAEEGLMEKLGQDYDPKTMPDEKIAQRGWYGRCVYESDNNVMDEQTVTMAWEEDSLSKDTLDVGRGPKTAIFHMTYPTQAQCERRGRMYGSLGEITYDSSQITVHTFADNNSRTHVIPKQDPEVEKAHGGGDFGLTKAFVGAVHKADTGEMSVDQAQQRYIGADLDEIIRSHAVVFAAEEARMGKKVIEFGEWWKGKERQYGIAR
jgi:predicted dehydrogenase